MAGAGGRKGGEDSVGAGGGHALEEGGGGFEEFGGIAGARKGSVGVNDSKLIVEVRLNAVWGLRNLSYKASFSFFSCRRLAGGQYENSWAFFFS
jgi:hypothetical protein